MLLQNPGAGGRTIVELAQHYRAATPVAPFNQLVLPNFIGQAKVADGALRPVVEQSFPPSLTPAVLPLCKM